MRNGEKVESEKRREKAEITVRRKIGWTKKKDKEGKGEKRPSSKERKCSLKKNEDEDEGRKEKE